MSTPETPEPLGDLTLTQFLDAKAARTPAPASGSAAAITVAVAAALCAMSARFSESSLDGAAGIAAAADELRARVLVLGAEDSRAYAAVLAARRLPPDSESADAGLEGTGLEGTGLEGTGLEGTGRSGRQEALEAAMSHAVAVPLEIAEIGAEVRRLATRVAFSGNPNLLGDALSAMLLAEAGSAASSTIAEINVSEGRRAKAGKAPPPL
jgi:formiminotetrahydrofolate cyclodeaminase